MLKWEVIEGDDPRFAPEYGPPCPGLHLLKDTHQNEWKLVIEEGQITLTSGCQDCDRVVWDPVGGEDLEMSIPIKGYLMSHVEVYGYETPEYNHWWEFIPEAIERAD